jgi:hypothetical protein
LSHTTYSKEQPFSVPRHRRKTSEKKVSLKCTNKLKSNLTFIHPDFHIGNLWRSAPTT